MARAVIHILWLFLPGLVANMMPVFANRFNWLPALNIPLDQERHWQGARLLGPNKTVRGLLLGIFSGAFVALAQYHLGSNIPQPLVIKNPAMALAWGALLGCGALGGDAMKSFIKRRMQIPPGQSWWPWDQIDIALGMVIVSAPFVRLTSVEILLSIVVIGSMMMIVSSIGVYSGIKKQI